MLEIYFQIFPLDIFSKIYEMHPFYLRMNWSMPLSDLHMLRLLWKHKPHENY